MKCLMITALVTPFKEEKLDERGLDRLLDFQKENGVSTISLLGTTGEGPTLTLEEKKTILKKGRDAKFDMMVACGSPSTSSTIEMAKIAEQEGASSLLVITPYFNRPTQEGIFRHFEKIAHSMPLPIYIYTHPGRAAIHLEFETLKRLSSIPNIVGVKEASCNLAHIERILHEIPDFEVLSGDDGFTFPIMALGGCGVVSVTSNVFPKKMQKLVENAFQGRFVEARKNHFELLPLFKALNLETNPIPVKAALSFLKLPGGDPRLPLTPFSKQKEKELISVLRNLCD